MKKGMTVYDALGMSVLAGHAAQMMKIQQDLCLSKDSKYTAFSKCIHDTNVALLSLRKEAHKHGEKLCAYLEDYYTTNKIKMKVKVELEVTIPETSESPTQDQIKEWVEFQLGYGGTLGVDNPLFEEDINGFIEECFVDTRPF